MSILFISFIVCKQNTAVLSKLRNMNFYKNFVIANKRISSNNFKLLRRHLKMTWRATGASNDDLVENLKGK